MKSILKDGFSGAILIDKPKNMTSFDVLRVIKKETGIKKIGHSGTLDPLATGLLVVPFSKATKLQSMFLNDDKSYEADILFGVSTSTDDLEGEVLEKDESINLHNIKFNVEEKLNTYFLGKLTQVPPIYSAIKVNGEPLYKKARRGESIEVKPREIFIKKSDFKVLDSKNIKAFITCSKGTYIRSIARDAGKLLKTEASLKNLKRISSGNFFLKDSSSLEDFLEDKINPKSVFSLEDLARGFKGIYFDKKEATLIKNGIQAPLKKGEVRDLKANFISLWEKKGEGERLIGFSNKIDDNYKIRFLI